MYRYSPKMRYHLPSPRRYTALAKLDISSGKVSIYLFYRIFVGYSVTFDLHTIF